MSGTVSGAVLIVVAAFVAVATLRTPAYPRVRLVERLGRVPIVGAPAPRRVGRLTGSLEQVALGLVPAGRRAVLERAVQGAHLQASWSVGRIAVWKAVGTAVAVVVAALALVSSPDLTGVVTAVLLVTVAQLAPERIVLSKAVERRAAIAAEVADVVDQLAVVVRAGLGLDAAMARVARSSTGMFGEELQRVVQDVRVGMPRADALRSLAERVDLPELGLLVRALVQSDKLGVPLSATLELQANEIRIARRQAAEERAMKLPVKILLPTMLCMLPALMAIVLGPAMLNVYEALVRGR